MMMKAKMGIMSFIMLVGLLATLLVPVPASAAVQPVLPTAFYGSVTIGNSPAPVGTVVTGKIVNAVGSPGQGSFSVTTAGQYGAPGLADKLTVQTNNTDDQGKTIQFYVQEPSWPSAQLTSYTAVYDSGTHQLDISFTPTSLSVTINQAAGQADPTNTSPINFTVVFSQSVSDFTTGDVTLTGTAGATTGTVTGSGTTYNVAVSGMTSDGTVIASLAAGVAHDAAGNANTASTSTDNTVTYDTSLLSVTINQAAGQADPTKTSPINFTVVFSESVTDFATGDVTLSGTAGGTKTATVTGTALPIMSQSAV